MLYNDLNQVILLIMASNNIHLGLSVGGGHNSAVCMFDIDNGVVIGNLEVERLTRKKNDGALSEDIIAKILARYGLHTAQVRSIATNFNYGLSLKGKGMDSPSQRIFEKTDINIFGNTIDCALVDHHASHAMCCAVSAPDFEKMVVLTSDTMGDLLNTCGFFIARVGNSFEFHPIMRSYVYRAPSSLWFSIAEQNYKLDGFQGPGKLMALSAYGRSKADIDAEMFNYFTNPILKQGHPEGFGFGEDLSDARSERSQDVVHALQKATTKYLEGMISYISKLAIKEFNSIESLGISGGLALNIVATSDAARRNNLSKLHVPPFPNDSGLAYGNCVIGAMNLYPSSVNFDKLNTEFTAFNGPVYSNTNYIEALSSLSGDFFIKRMNEVEYIENIVQDLKDRLICMRFFGRSESGPRALGNRSILYDPSDSEGRERLNLIKRREWYRPFAPMVLMEMRNNVLVDHIDTSIYMTTSSSIRPEWRSTFSSAMHVDFTCRPQIVEKIANPFLHKVLSSFYEKTGIPGLLNTSFNIQGPIVETPQEAVNAFLRADTNPKVLYLGMYRVSAASR